MSEANKAAVRGLFEEIWNKNILLVSVLALLIAAPSQAQFVAEQITVGNAASRLFGGTDADGGIGDWYVSNGVVEAIIDNTGIQLDLFKVTGGTQLQPIQNEAAPTGGTLIDLGLVGQNNDQLAQLFTAGGLSTENLIVYFSVSAYTTPTSATVTAMGSVLGFPAGLVVVTNYAASGDDPFLTVTTTVTNPTTTVVSGLGGFLDVFLWTQRAIVPFSPLPGLGFNHPPLDIADLSAALETPSYAAGPGNIGPSAGVMDPPSGTVAGEVSYGLLGVLTRIDNDPSDAFPPISLPVCTLVGVSNNTITAFGNPPFGQGPLPPDTLQPGGFLEYTRRIYVGGRNDVASVANPMISALSACQPPFGTPFATGTISGDVDAVDTTDVKASVIAMRTAGPTIIAFPDGTPTTQFRTDATGAFGGVVLPEGTYDLEFRSVERDPVVVSGVSVTAGADTPVSVPSLSGLGTVQFTVREIVRGPDPKVPARVTFKGIKGTPDPSFNKDFDAFLLPADGPPLDLVPESFPGGPAQVNFFYLADGTGSVQVRPGLYQVFVSRGPEYTVIRRVVFVREGQTKKVWAGLRRVIDTTGFVSADFHIHSARSFDSSAALDDRVASFAGEGVEVMVSSDHDYHVDYGSSIAGLGIGDRIASIVGNEVTGSLPGEGFPSGIGHINAWPLPILSAERRDGAIEDEFVAPNFIFSRLRALGADVIQYNHPRAGLSGLTIIGFFNNIGYDPVLPIDSPPNDVLLDDDVTGISGVSNPQGFRNIDFDVLEVANGMSVRGFLAVRRDWLSLLNQVNTPVNGGVLPFIPGTAVSDSHRITLETAGYARTYVGGAGDDPASLDVDTFNKNVKAGNMFGTTGPFVEFTIEDGRGASAGLGETLVPATDTVWLKIRVQASHWIPVEEVRVISNGFVVPDLVFDRHTRPRVRPGPKIPTIPFLFRGFVIRFEAKLPVKLSEDSYFLVEAGAKLEPPPSPPEFVDTIVPGNVPIAFTNPIFVDLDSDGFDPPGLPVMGTGAVAAAAEVTSLAELEPRKREEVRRHFPIHRIRLSRKAVAKALRSRQ